MARRITASALLIVVLLAMGAAGLAILRRLAPHPATATPERPPLMVDAVRLTPTTVVAPLEGYGTARADRSAAISAQVTGQVAGLAEGLRDGAAVEAGVLLVRIDAREYEAQLERARSQLAADRAVLARIDVEEASLGQLTATARDEAAVAEREYDRIRKLLESGQSSLRELDAARAAVKRARLGVQELERQLAAIPDTRAQQQATCALRRADVDLAELYVERCVIRAPFAGRVEQVSVELGEQVGPGRRLMVLVDPDLIEIPLALPVSLRPRVYVGAPVHLALESRPERAWSGRIVRIGPSADEQTRTFSAFIEVSNRAQPEPLMPGMFVRAQVEGPTLTDVLLVPRAAVRRERVFVCEAGQAFQRAVEIVEHVRDRTVVRGLSPGQVVITSNLDVLYDGAPVQPELVNEHAAGTP
jgi:multidrug resistance efflux pump